MVVRCLICQLTITTLHEQEKRLPYERVGLCSKCEEICREIVAISNNLNIATIPIVVDDTMPEGYISLVGKSIAMTSIDNSSTVAEEGSVVKNAKQKI